MAKTKIKTFEQLKPRYTGVITYDDTMPGNMEIERGVVLILGTSPNAKVTVLSFDGDSRRGTQMDILRKCTVSGDGNTLTIIGESARALHEFKLTDITVEITVDLAKPCADCGYS